MGPGFGLLHGGGSSWFFCARHKTLLLMVSETILCGVFRGSALTSGFRLGSHPHFSPKPFLRLHGPDSWTHSWQLPLIHRFLSLPLSRFRQSMVSHHSHQRRRAVVTRRLPDRLGMGLLNSNHRSRAPEARRKNQGARRDNGSLQIHGRDPETPQHTSHHCHPPHRQNRLSGQ